MLLVTSKSPGAGKLKPQQWGPLSAVQSAVRHWCEEPVSRGGLGTDSSSVVGVWPLWEGAGNPINVFNGEEASLSGSAAFNDIGVKFSTVDDYVELGVLNSDQPSDAVTVLCHYEKTDATNRASTAFGLSSASDSNRLLTHLPYTNGNVYWDFGGVVTGTSRLIVSGLSFGDDLWGFTAGARGMEIWQNGDKVASHGNSAVRLTNGYPLVLGKSQHGADLAIYKSHIVFRTQLHTDAVEAWQDAPYLLLEKPISKIYSIGGGTPTGNAVINGNAAAVALGYKKGKGSATVAETSSATSQGYKKAFGEAVVAGISNVLSTGYKIAVTDVTVTGTASCIATGYAVSAGGANAVVTGNAAVSATGYKVGKGSAVAAGVANIVSIGSKVAIGNAAVSGIATVTAIGRLPSAGVISVTLQIELLKSTLTLSQQKASLTNALMQTPLSIELLDE